MPPQDNDSHCTKGGVRSFSRSNLRALHAHNHHVFHLAGIDQMTLVVASSRSVKLALGVLRRICFSSLLLLSSLVSKFNGCTVTLYLFEFFSLVLR